MENAFYTKIKKLLSSSLIVIFILFGCESSNSNYAEFPELIVDANNDTIYNGEIYRAKVYLSDTSYFSVKRYGKVHDFLPLFRINGEIKETASTYFHYEEVVKLDSIPSEGILREWQSGIIFPHPVSGDVEISSRNSFIILPSK
ncbi:hypothetical protein [Ekhidna sp.]